VPPKCLCTVTIKLRRMGLLGRVQRIGRNRNAYKVFVGKSERKWSPEKRSWRRVILKLIWKKQDGKIWIEFIWLEIGDQPCKHGNEHSGSVKCMELLDLAIAISSWRTVPFSSACLLRIETVPLYQLIAVDLAQEVSRWGFVVDKVASG
jgi:hypothetical protein